MIDESATEAARHLQSIEDDRAFESNWRALVAQFSDADVVWQEKPRRLIRQRKFDEAIALIEARDFGSETDRERQILKADLLFWARDHGRADQIFSRLIANAPDQQDARLVYAKRLMFEGKLVKCRELLRPVEDGFPSGTQACRFSEHSRAIMAVLSAKEGRPLSEDDDARILAMKHAVLSLRDRYLRASGSAGLGKVALVTGGLGAGGAERQITRLASRLVDAQRAGKAIAGVEISSSAELILRGTDVVNNKDFFLPATRAQGVAIFTMTDLPPQSPREMGITDPELLVLLSCLPASVTTGLERLTPHFLERKFDVISIWQDGACLFSALAALLAGVPQIHLVIRDMPPTMRPFFYRPEYEVLYRAMAQIPGVQFISNSKAAAKAYSEWIDIPQDRIAILYNGVEPMSSVGDQDGKAAWDALVRRTPDAARTIGGVFRFEPGKQPHVWIEFAAHYLRRHPDTRFVLVGGGSLLKDAERQADELGIGDRILFTGRSEIVGYWLSRMDVMVHLSRHEGLPNVLLEAQYMGLRVVATPAGGAAECIVDGVTGRIVSTCEQPDPEEVAACVNELLNLSANENPLAPGGAGRQFLDEHFAVDKMLGDFVTLCADNAAGMIQKDRIVGTQVSKL